MRSYPVSQSCDSCGKYTGMDTGLCGQCAEDYNDRSREAGIKRINKRRTENGLEPLSLLNPTRAQLDEANKILHEAAVRILKERNEAP